MIYLTTFNTQLVDFSRELSEMFPQDTDIKWTHNMISLLKRTNPRKLYEIYIRYFTQYREKILARDEEFFTTHNFKEIGEQTNQQEYSQVWVRQLRQHWGNMSENSRNVAWLRMEILFKISDQITKELTGQLPCNYSASVATS